MSTIAFHTLGCKLNFAESSDLARRFAQSGYKQVDFKEKADVYVINTCTVTQIAEKKCRNAIRQAHSLNPNAIIAVIGCFSQLNPEQIENIEGVDIILGNDDKHKLVDYVLTHQKTNTPTNQVFDISHLKTFYTSYSSDDRTRSFLKVQDGCDYFCTYCAIPHARGRSRNENIETIIACAKELAKENKKEVVLTGVNIGDFGKSTNETFLQLIKRLDEIEEIQRYRISSIEPNLITEEIIDFCTTSRAFLPHFHIPLQSGDNKILKLMHRKYERELFAQRVNYIKEKMPHAFIAADVIVGFPQETEEDFQSTYNFIESLPLAFLHVFTYSERPNTIAAKMEGKVPISERRRRSQELQKLSLKKKQQFYERNQGNKVSVLWEADNENGLMFGFSENYIRVARPFDEKYINHITEETLEEIDSTLQYYKVTKQ
ncbi:MAG: tRNA (N(6)-L-threonylcarbamoyladenosine(37)-C(2))-methylthiotransferase MtaB [Bacteroidales bacterium]|nr:tRNA (N(6)-L-threonylcarbamoyladenosine(37)-C(2))-methylthiotransferase MtaB [Bacteroidales bacterium]